MFKLPLCTVVAPILCAAPLLAEAKAQIEAKLAATTMASVSFKEKALKDAIQTIAAEAGVSILLDTKVVDGDKAVTLELVNISAQNALSVLLKQEDLVQRYADGVLWVTTKEAAEAKPVLVTKTYDVRDITVTIRDFPGPKVDLEGAGDRFKDAPSHDDDEDEDKSISTDDLIETIQDTVAPDIWDKNGNTIATFKGNLVISTTAEVHDQIKALLNQMR